MLRALITLHALFVDRFDRDDDEGATAVEYGLMIALIAVAIIVAVTALGGGLNELFTRVKGQVDKAA